MNLKTKQKTEETTFHELNLPFAYLLFTQFVRAKRAEKIP